MAINKAPNTAAAFPVQNVRLFPVKESQSAPRRTRFVDIGFQHYLI
jgi:hypothetical protein